MNNTLISSQPQIPMHTVLDKPTDVSILVKETIADARSKSSLPNVEKTIGRSFYGFWEVNK